MVVILALLITFLGVKTFIGGIGIGLLVWMGLVSTNMAVNQGFRGRRPLLTLDAHYWLTVLTTQGAVIGYMAPVGS